METAQIAAKIGQDRKKEVQMFRLLCLNLFLDRHSSIFEEDLVTWDK